MKRFFLASLMGMLISTLAFGVDIKSQIGTQDLNVDADGAAHGTFQRRTSTGGTITLDKIDGNQIPWSLDYSRTIRPGNITGNSTGRIQNYSIGSASYTDNGYFGDLITRDPWVDVRAYGATATNATVTAAIAAAPSGGTVLIPAIGGPYTFSDNVTISKPLTILSDEAVINVAAGKKGFVIASDNVTIRGLNIVGAQSAVNNDAEHGISIVGTSSTYYNKLKIQNNIIRRFGGYGIYVKHVRGFDISHNEVSDIDYGGITAISSDRGIVSGNRVSDIKASGGNGYGISIADATESDANAVPSSDVVISGNYVRDIPLWTGIDTHGGKRLSFTGNVIDNCYNGIAVGSADNTDNLPKFAPKEVTISGNSISSGVTGGTAAYGISFTGAYNSGVIDNATGSITGNIIRGYGRESDAPIGAINLHSTNGGTVSGNTIIEPGSVGIFLANNNSGFSVTGNTIVDPWSNTSNSPAAIHLDAGGQSGVILGNTLSHGTKSATYLYPFGILLDDVSATSEVYLGTNDMRIATFPLYEDPASVKNHGASYSASATYDPASLADNASLIATLNVGGAKLGDSVTCSFDNNTTAGMLIIGSVSASGETKCTFLNRSGGTVDLGSGTLYSVTRRP